MAQLKNTTATKMTLGGGVDVAVHINNIEAKLDKISDYIIESGTSGIWTYRKWSNGIAECWGNTIIAPNVWEVWGNAYECHPYLDPISFPANLFSEDPEFFSSSCGAQGTIGIENFGTVSKTQTPILYAVRPNQGNNGNIKVSMRAIGKWKS